MAIRKTPALSTACLFLSATLAQAAGTTFQVLCEGSTPEHVRVTVDDAVFALSEKDAGFGGAVEPKGADLRNADLDADYRDQSVASVPLRLKNTEDSVVLWLVQPSSLTCNQTRINYLNGQLHSSLRNQMAAYLEAKAIYSMQNGNRCGSVMLPLAAKLWFDASYNLARAKSYFRLDPAAADAYRQFDDDYVKQYENENAALSMKVLNDQKLDQVKQKDYSGAAATNKLMQDKLSADASFADVVQTRQHITSKMLERDGNFIATRMDNPG